MSLIAQITISLIEVCSYSHVLFKLKRFSYNSNSELHASQYQK